MIRLYPGYEAAYSCTRHFSHITRSQNEAEGLPEQQHRDVAFSLNFMKRSLQHLIMPFEECIEFLAS